MNNIKLPKLTSRYIPVHSIGHIIKSDIHWWKNNSTFIYPNVLINLMTCSKEQIEEIRKDMNEELFLLTDSGGFQVISGQCNLNWESSLIKQIELGASKIFSFDIPTVKIKIGEKSVNASMMVGNEIKETIIKNIDVAIKQSKYLKEKYPEELKKFCYIMQAPSIDFYKFNIEILNERIGIENYSIYFPGGIICSCKDKSIINMCFILRLLYNDYISKGVYVHFLGAGSFYRMILLVRNKITTFDSSTMLQGTRINEFYNPIDINRSIQLTSDNFLFNTQFCICPVCSNVDYNKFIEGDNKTMIGRTFIAHNLWHFLKVNILLDAIPLKQYTETVNKLYKLPDNIKICLDFCDDCDKMGFELSYQKYKQYLKKDETKQKNLF